MFKKMLLAGAVLVGGSVFASQRADAQFGSQIWYGGPVIGGPVISGPVISGPVVRTINPYVAPRYHAGYRYGYQPNYRYAYPSYRYNTPVYRSYRAPVGPGYYGPGYYGPGYGSGYGRTSGFSLNIGPVFRGW